MNKKEKIESLFHETINNRFDMSFVDKFIKLKSIYTHDKRLQKECDLNIAMIYSNNGHLESALDIFLELIKERNIISPYHFEIITLYSINHLTQLGRLEEARNIFEENVHEKELTAFNFRLTMLAWFVENFNPSNAELLPFKGLFDNAKEDLGYLSKEPELKAQILEANNLQKITARNYGNVNISLRGKSTMEQIEIIKKFINTDPPLFFRELAEKLLFERESR